METDISKIKELAEEKDEENWEFRTFLKMCDIRSRKIDRIVRRLYKKVSSEIDCTACANCCKDIQPALDQEDMEGLARGLGISVAQLKDRFLTEDDPPGKYVFKTTPCPLLKDNICSQYDYRPSSCVSYPHLHKKDFTSRTITVVWNCSVCPIVYNVYEELKREVWY